MALRSRTSGAFCGRGMGYEEQSLVQRWERRVRRSGRLRRRCMRLITQASNHTHDNGAGRDHIHGVRRGHRARVGPQSTAAARRRHTGRHGSIGIFTGRSDASGRYTISGVPADTIWVEATADSGYRSPCPFGGTLGADAIVDVHIVDASVLARTALLRHGRGRTCRSPGRSLKWSAATGTDSRAHQFRYRVKSVTHRFAWRVRHLHRSAKPKRNLGADGNELLQGWIRASRSLVQHRVRRDQRTAHAALRRVSARTSFSPASIRPASRSPCGASPTSRCVRGARRCRTRPC